MVVIRCPPVETCHIGDEASSTQRAYNGCTRTDICFGEIRFPRGADSADKTGFLLSYPSGLQNVERSRSFVPRMFYPEVG